LRTVPKILVPAAAVAAALLSLARYTPEVWPGEPYPPVWFGAARVAPLLAQLKDPVHWDRTYEFAGGGVLRWRLLFPVVGHDLGLTPTQYLLLPWLGAFWMLLLVGRHARTLGGSPARAAAAVALAATSSAWFVPTGWLGQFDPFYLVALLAVAFSPSTVAVCAAGLLGPWVDERFLLMLPACACLRWKLYPTRRWVLALALSLAPYLAVRLVALLVGDPSVSTHIALQGPAFPRYASFIPVGWWFGWRMAWALIVAAVVAATGRGAAPAQRWLLVTSLAAGLDAVALLAWDSSRSIAVLIPFMVLGAARWRDLRTLCALVALNFVLPAAHVSAVVSGASVTNALMPITSWLLRG
jgi:hypothetical protein